MRNRHFFALDLILLAPLPFLVMGLRVESVHWPAELHRMVGTYALFALAIRLSVALQMGLYRTMWKHASLAELEVLLLSGALSGALTFLLGAIVLPMTGSTPSRLPYSSLIWDALLAANLLAAPRLAVRLFARPMGPVGGRSRRAVIVGAGEVGQQILRTLRTHGSHVPFEIVGVADDDRAKANQTLSGLPVLGTIGQLELIVTRHVVDDVIIAIPSARGALVRRIVAACSATGAKMQIVPSMTDLISGRVKVEQLRQVEIEDLLRLEVVTTDLAAVGLLARGKTVLVSGAGGSIGSELCRQVAALRPEHLVMLDHSENQVFEITNEIRRLFPKLRLSGVIADIRDVQRLYSIFQRFQPHAVFHAAAHKHVPLMEDNITEAVTNNVIATRNIVDASVDADTQHFVAISTDKAVRPTSIMGATKRVAELIVRAAADATGRNFVSVRFGNVLGSRGSVIPAFLEQIKRGGPVTVTHPEMRRNFMTIPEAVQLVLQAGALGQGGELFVLDMCEPVKIVDLARDLIRLSGLEEGVDIEYSGIRPGEKLYAQVLFGHEDIRCTAHPNFLCTDLSKADHAVLERLDIVIRSMLSEPDADEKLRALLHHLVPDFAHDDARTNPTTRAGSESSQRTSGERLIPRVA